jgi:hypothetical protein
MMKKFTAIWVVMLLSACSAKTKVHFYTLHLPQDKINKVVQSIDKEKFDVLINRLPYPVDINDNAIVYSPSSNSRERLNLLMTVLSNQGFSISNASLIAANNHSFTENNLGLYLYPDDYVQPELNDVDNSYKVPMVNEYGAVDCQHTTTLYLKEPNEFLIEIDKWDDQREDYYQEFLEGNWTISNDNVLFLSSVSWQEPLTFKKSNISNNSEHNLRKGIKFTPVDLDQSGDKSLIGKTDKIMAEFTKKIESVYCTYIISVAL